MGEYKFVSGELSHCQKVLNQWKHKYNITIINMLAGLVEDTVIILVMRSDR